MSDTSGIVTVVDGYPSTLGWLGSAYRHRLTSLGVEHFGQAGSIQDLYVHHGVDTNAIVNVVQKRL